MVRHILFPVDFSPQCVAASATVKAWASRLGASVTLLHIFEPVVFYSPETAPIEAEMQLLRGLAQKELNGFLAGGWGALALKRVLVEGSTAASIVSYAHANEVDLIVMPTQSQSRFRQLLLGSVTASVLHDSEVPVWTSAHIADPGLAAEPQRILCAVDCGPETERVVGWAMTLAKEFGAGLKVIFVDAAIGETFESGIAKGAHRFVVDRAKEDYGLATAGLLDAPPLEIIERGKLVESLRSE